MIIQLTKARLEEHECHFGLWAISIAHDSKYQNKQRFENWMLHDCRLLGCYATRRHIPELGIVLSPP
jgi:hypothetical protein